MKKFALLGAVAALATAGGVFAAWQFSEGNAPTNPADVGVTVTIEEDYDIATYGSLGTPTGAIAVHFTHVATPEINNNAITEEATSTYAIAYTADSDDHTNEGTINVTASWAESSFVFDNDTDADDTDDVTISFSAIKTQPFSTTSGSFTITDEDIENSITTTGTIKSETHLGNFITWLGEQSFKIKVSVTA